MQLYFLLIITNLAAGFTLSAPLFSKRWPAWGDGARLFETTGGRIALTVLLLGSGLAGLFMLQKNQPFFVGDLIPSLTALIQGIVFACALYRRKYPEGKNGLIGKFEAIFSKHGAVFGIIGALAGIAHFFLAEAVFF